MRSDGRYTIGEAVRPSHELAEVLSGRMAWGDASESVRSWARLPIYQAARQIMAMDGKGPRRNALGRIPASIRPMVEAEVLRLWALR